MRPQPEPRPSGRRGSPAPLSTLNPARTFPAQEAVDSSDNPYPPDQPTAACALDIRTRFHPASRTRAYCETRNSCILGPAIDSTETCLLFWRHLFPENESAENKETA